MAIVTRLPVFSLVLALALPAAAAAQDEAPAPDDVGEAPPAPEAAEPAPEAAPAADEEAAPAEAPAPVAPSDDPGYIPPPPPPPENADEDPFFNDETRYRREGDFRPDGEAGDGKGGKPDAKKPKRKQKNEEPPPDPVSDEPYSPEGLSGWAVWPIQLCGGCATVTVLDVVTTPLLAIPFLGWILKPLIMWGVAGMVMASVGDGFGRTRGTIGWPMLAGMCTDIGCGAISGLLTLVVTVLVLSLTGVSAVGLIQSVDLSNVDPEAILVIAGVVLSGVGIVTAFTASMLGFGTRCASLNAASAVYQLSADDKRDPDFRFPGFFSPDHGYDDAPPPKAKKDKKKNKKKRRQRPGDEGDDGDDGDEVDDGDDEGYDEEVDDEEVAPPSRQSVRRFELPAPRVASASSSMAY